ncbi:MAG: UvrB/UvrC motif-containing protein, partial [Gammaproteobacteria bacterium]
QTIGRAARNINGRAILYADEITGSMQRAIDESNRRREAQLQFNLERGITPAGVKKRVLDVMEGAHGAPGSTARQRSRGSQEAKSVFARINLADPVVVRKEIEALEQQMYEQARNLAFEEAAATRDRIAELKEQLIIQG